MAKKARTSRPRRVAARGRLRCAAARDGHRGGGAGAAAARRRCAAGTRDSQVSARGARGPVLASAKNNEPVTARTWKRRPRARAAAQGRVERRRREGAGRSRYRHPVPGSNSGAAADVGPPSARERGLQVVAAADGQGLWASFCLNEVRSSCAAEHCTAERSRSAADRGVRAPTRASAGRGASARWPPHNTDWIVDKDGVVELGVDTSEGALSANSPAGDQELSTCAPWRSTATDPRADAPDALPLPVQAEDARRRQICARGRQGRPRELPQ